MKRTVTGTVEGTGATITIQLGFTPKAVQLFNIDGLCTLFWSENMTDAYGLKAITAGTISKITSLGITPYTGSENTNNAGFQIGADTDVNVSGETIEYIAYRD
ncbi:MAG: hypothetical protein Unbinned7913contig1002_39 [Prokaryotic dsDNA virus sp.]|jgi:hypothetical protein|nr:hypothetical protein [Parcubacteria group bacterium]QDP51284.1 MAG: hypothetical protein Unbinned7913contig1002_39 [Prokaryotic dsDNA virus sp.]|tara:strand:+ start:7117 stop:7425 length:309 start_codon:yes stop_codon:yes gene_type:complete